MKRSAWKTKSFLSQEREEKGAGRKPRILEQTVVSEKPQSLHGLKVMGNRNFLERAGVPMLRERLCSTMKGGGRPGAAVLGSESAERLQQRGRRGTVFKLQKF